MILCLALVVSSIIAAQGQGDNLLTNPGFEAPFAEVGSEDQVAEGWTAWSLGDAADRPLYSAASLDDSDRVREGEDAQKYASFLAAHTAGVYQTVGGLTPGESLTFSAYVYVWSSSDDSDRAISENSGGVTVEVGLDPAGGIDPESASIIWSLPQEIYDEYTLAQVTAASDGDTVTAFVRTIVAEPVLVTDIFLDEAALVVGAGTDAPITPEVTDELIVETPVETPIEAPTIEVIATETDAPVETPTEAPTVEASATPEPAIELPTQVVLPTLTDDPAITLTTEALNQTATALIGTATANALTASAPSATPEASVTPDFSPTPDLNATATSLALQVLATQGQIDFLTREAEGILTATALAASPTLLAPTATFTATFTDVPQATATPVVVVVTATFPPASETPLPTDAPTDAPSPTPTAALVTPDAPQGTPISPEVDESFPGRIIHTVQNRETVAELAARYGSSTQAIIEANGLNEDALIFIGQLLIIPVRVPPLTITQGAPTLESGTVATPIAPTVQPTFALTGNETTYTVQRGDVLSSVASRFNTTVTVLAQLNGIVNVNRLDVGQVLLVPGPSGTDSPANTPIQATYVVQYGDTLNRLALRFGVTAGRIAEVNRIANINLIYAGQSLLIPAP
jgi:LysM repeat protein